MIALNPTPGVTPSGAPTPMVTDAAAAFAGVVEASGDNTILGGVDWTDAAGLFAVFFPALTGDAAAFRVYYSVFPTFPDLSNINLKSAATFSIAYSSFTDNTLDFAKLPDASAVTGAPAFYCNNCGFTALANVASLRTRINDTTNLQFNANALDSDAVDAILAEAVASGKMACTLNLAQTPSAVPSAAGLADRDTLVNERSWIVSVDS